MKNILLLFLVFMFIFIVGCSSSDVPTESDVPSEISVKECLRTDGSKKLALSHLCSTNEDCILYVSQIDKSYSQRSTDENDNLKCVETSYEQIKIDGNKLKCESEQDCLQQMNPFVNYSLVSLVKSDELDLLVNSWKQVFSCNQNICWVTKYSLEMYNSSGTIQVTPQFFPDFPVR
ncbi:hypothetical protein J4418_04030 [Candidatus Woesearchaeota archaeon]|nr:hypothetical protein [Candidatus Woesearchaeota archaeon]